MLVRLLKRARLLVIATIAVGLLTASVATEVAGQMGCRIVGFAHAFDFVVVPVCNVFGACWPQQQQIPCQHPLWDCR